MIMRSVALASFVVALAYLACEVSAFATIGGKMGSGGDGLSFLDSLTDDKVGLIGESNQGNSYKLDDNFCTEIQFKKFINASWCYTVPQAECGQGADTFRRSLSATSTWDLCYWNGQSCAMVDGYSFKCRNSCAPSENVGAITEDDDDDDGNNEVTTETKCTKQMKEVESGVWKKITSCVEINKVSRMRSLSDDYSDFLSPSSNRRELQSNCNATKTMISSKPFMTNFQKVVYESCVCKSTGSTVVQECKNVTNIEEPELTEAQVAALADDAATCIDEKPCAWAGFQPVDGGKMCSEY